MKEDILKTDVKEEELKLRIEAARKNLIAYRDATKKSQARIARELGVSDGVVSSFLSGTYKTPHQIVDKVEALLSMVEHKELAPKAPNFVATSVSKQVIDAVEYCHLQGKIGVIYGDAGIGKTAALKHYISLHPETIFITISPVFATMSGVNDLLSEQVGVKEKNARRIYTEIVNRLRDSGRVIIIDEAQHLTKKTLEHLRSISDEANIGICLVGNEEVYSRLKGSGKADFAQIFSRVAIRKPVFTSTIKERDIELIFSDSHFDKEAINFLYRISQTKYGIRGAVNVFIAAVALFETVSKNELIRVAKEMNIAS